MRLGENRYGKSGIRLATVLRRGERHDFTDLTVDVAVEGDFAAAHVAGDNARILPTDTMRGTVYALAKREPVGSVESFGLRLARHFVETVEPVSAAIVSLAEQPWTRIDVDASPHPHAFTKAAGGRRTAVVQATSGGDADVLAGVEDLYVAKTAGSGFAGFLSDELTTLPETDDRILATAITAHWRLRGLDHDWDRLAADVRRVLLTAFATHDSASLQHTLWAMGQAVLAAHDAVAEIRFTLPNQHHVMVDLSPYGLRNEGEVFVVTDRPFGVIEGTVTREPS